MKNVINTELQIQVLSALKTLTPTDLNLCRQLNSSDKKAYHQKQREIIRSGFHHIVEDLFAMQTMIGSHIDEKNNK
jgi:hypothetical protein